jgi:WD40 repeat protein
MANDKDFILKNPVEVGGPTNVTLGTITGSAINLSTGNYFKDTLAANTTYTISNAGDVQSFQLEVTGGVGSGYNIEGGSYTGTSYSVATQAPATSSVRFKPDGTKMFATGTTNDNFVEYALSTPWDITTATYTNAIGVQVQNPECMLFSADGSQVFAFGTTNSVVGRFDLPTPWTLAGASYQGTTSFSSQVSSNYGKGMAFNGDGTKFYVVSGTGQSIYQYTLSTAYDVDTRSYDSVAFGTSPNSINPEDMAFNGDGTKLYICAYGPDTVAEYDLTTPYDISSVTYVSSMSVLSEVAVVNGMAFKPDGSSLFVTGQTNNTVFEYNTSTASIVTWPSSIEFAGGVAPAAPAIGETDIFTFSTDDGGTSYIGTKTADNLS